MKQPQPNPQSKPADLTPAHVGIIELLAQIVVRNISKQTILQQPYRWGASATT